MEMRQKRINVYRTTMRRRTFTNWSNILLRSVDKQIVDVFNPSERVLLQELLEIVLTNSGKKFKSQERRASELEAFLKRAEELKKNYFKSEQEQDVNRHVVVQFIWELIEFSHITPGKCLWEIENAPMNAKEILLKWLNSKFRGRRVKNFTSDWNDGTALCELINGLEPGLIPAQIYLQGSWPQRNVKVAMETAEKAWGIPLIISPDDMICSEVDELSVMTYIALIFEYELERNSANGNSSFKNSANEKTRFSTNENLKHSTNRGASLRNSTNQKTTLSNGHLKQGSDYKDNSSNAENDSKNVTSSQRQPETGKIGKEIEYRLNLHDVNANEITVSVEFKPAEKLTQEYTPNLKVFSMGKGRFRVKYTPNLAGNYRLSMYYQDEHIADSPYCVKVPCRSSRLENDRVCQNTRNDFNNNESEKKSNEHTTEEKPTKSGDALTKDGFYGYDGEGLKHATVGKLAMFTIITDNRNKGPLSVCINCPAVSLPVPHVTTTYSKHYSTHNVAYMPTIAGTYNIYIRWGLKLINGSHFEVNVSDQKKSEARVSYTLDNSKKRESTQFSHIKVYYSSTSLDPDVIRNTEDMEKLLQRYGATRSSSDDTWVSIDLELQKDERDLIFRLAGTRKLPLLFIHEECLGSFEEVCELDRRNELEERLVYKVRRV